MKINKIKVSNFKSFKDLDLELDNFNVIVGANASGKSNFVQIFKFLQDIEQDDLKNAVSMNGGVASLLNLHCNENVNCLKIHFKIENPNFFRPNNILSNVTQISCSFSLHSEHDYKSFAICSDEYLQNHSFESENQGSVFYSLQNEKPNVEISPPDLEKYLLFPPREFLSNAYKKDAPFFQILHRFLDNRCLSRIGIYDIDPHKSKEPTAIAGKAELKKDGSNLALILDAILQDKDRQRKLTNLVSGILPFVDAVGTEKFMDRSLTLSLQEKYYTNKLRSDLLSDGTVNVTALLVAMYFEDNDVIFIEEPERNLHPHLISGLVEMMKEVSKKKQIFITTHSPELIKRAGIENLLLVSRNKEGNSVITRPRDSRQLKVFLENELGLDDLFIQNLLDLQ